MNILIFNPISVNGNIMLKYILANYSNNNIILVIDKVFTVDKYEYYLNEKNKIKNDNKIKIYTIDYFELKDYQRLSKDILEIYKKIDYFIYTSIDFYVLKKYYYKYDSHIEPDNYNFDNEENIKLLCNPIYNISLSFTSLIDNFILFSPLTNNILGNEKGKISSYNKPDVNNQNSIIKGCLIFENIFTDFCVKYNIRYCIFLFETVLITKDYVNPLNYINNISDYSKLNYQIYNNISIVNLINNLKIYNKYANIYINIIFEEDLYNAFNSIINKYYLMNTRYLLINKSITLSELKENILKFLDLKYQNLYNEFKKSSPISKFEILLFYLINKEYYYIKKYKQNKVQFDNNLVELNNDFSYKDYNQELELYLKNNLLFYIIK